MKMVHSKLIFIVMTIFDFVVNMENSHNYGGFDDWKKACNHQLITIGGFKEDQTKSSAFVHAYEHLIIPLDDNYNLSKKGILYKYQYELLKTFLEAHSDYLQFMFQSPMTWCKHNLHKFIGTVYEDPDESCKRRMITSRHQTFGETQIDALEYAFLRVKYYTDNKVLMNKTCLGYYVYIKEKVRHFVEYTYARSPSDYCNEKESPPAFLISLYQNGKFGSIVNKRFHQSSTNPPPVTQLRPLPFNIFENTSASADVNEGKGLNIDLNKPAPGEDEEN